MDSSTRSEINSIRREIQSIVRELENISYGIDRDFRNIGNERCAKAVGSIADKYQRVADRLSRL